MCVRVSFFRASSTDHHLGTSWDSRLSGPDPERRSYASFVTFNDPDGNNWLVQEVTKRLPGRVNAGATTFASPSDLAAALRRAAAAHGEHEKRAGQHDTEWYSWYAEYLVAEQVGRQPPPECPVRALDLIERPRAGKLRNHIPPTQSKIR
jgi:hypothetical protein